MVIQKSIEVSKSKYSELMEKLSSEKDRCIYSYPLPKKGTMCIYISINECDNKRIDEIIASVLNQTELFA